MRRTLKLLAPLAAALILAGRAATVQRPAATHEAPMAVPAAAAQRVLLHVQPSPSLAKSQDWELFRSEWRTAMTAAAGNAGKQFSYLDAAPESATEAGTLIVVTVNDYRYLSPGARFGFGIFTGNAFVDANATFYELPGRREIGRRKYSTSSSAWQGVFSAMTDRQVQAISAEMVKELGR
jgi:hypothetical protein